MTSKTNNSDTFALFKKDFNGKSLQPQAFKTFTNSMIEANKQIEQASKDKIKKEELEYFISDKFRQLADALRIAIPGLSQYLPDTDSLPDAPIDLIALEDSLKKDEKKQKN